MSNYERSRITKTTNTTTYTYTELNSNKVHHNKGALSKLKNKLNRKKKKTVTRSSSFSRTEFETTTTTKTTKFQKAKPIHISKQNNINARPLQSSQSLPIQNTCISPRLLQSYTNPTSPKSPPLTYSIHNHYNTYNYNNNNNNIVRRSAPAIHLQKQLPQAQQPYIHPNNRFQNKNNNNNYQRNQSIYKQNQPSNQYYNNNNYNQRPINNYNNNNNNNNNNHIRHQSYSNLPSKPLPNNANRIDRNQSVHSNHNYSNHYKGYERPLPPKKYIPKSQFKQKENNNNNNNINVHDALLWNSYIDEYKCEPQKIEKFLAFLKNTKEININYAKAKNIFINYKGKGKINVNINNKSLKIKQIKVIKKIDDGNDIKESKESYYESPESKIQNPKASIPIQPMSINAINDKDLKLWIEENYFSESLYNKLLNKHITFDTLKFIDINDLDPLCDELTLIISEKVRLKAAIKKLQNNYNKIYENNNDKIYKNNNDKNEVILDDVVNEGLRDDEFVIEDDNEEETAGADNGMDTMNVHGENDENMEGDNNDNIVPFTNGFIEEDNNEMYLPGSYKDNNNNNGMDNMDVGDMDNIDKLVLPGSYQDNDINDPGSYQDDNDNIDGGSLISEGVFYQMDNSGVNQVRDWLESIEMSMYYDLMLKHGFDSMKMIKLIKTAKDLEDIGIKMKAHQLKIITAIQNV